VVKENADALGKEENRVKREEAEADAKHLNFIFN
jgi:hypothetical protein